MSPDEGEDEDAGDEGHPDELHVVQVFRRSRLRVTISTKDMRTDAAVQDRDRKEVHQNRETQMIERNSAVPTNPCRMPREKAGLGHVADHLVILSGS
jgi:hypothetical protein